MSPATAATSRSASAVDGGGLRRFGADRHEFVATGARQEGVGGRGLHAARDVEQHAVAGGMTVEVVDLLEAVEIDAKHGEFLAACGRPFERRGQTLVQRRAVRQIGERVVMRKMRDAGLVALSLGDVLDHG